MNQTELFDTTTLLEPDNSPIEDIQIVNTYLYFSKEEHKEFRTIVKKLMKIYYPENYKTEANISDLILKILREKINKNGQQSTNIKSGQTSIGF